MVRIVKALFALSWIAALAVHEPGRPLDSDVVQMADAARGARHGAVTIAAKVRAAITGAAITEMVAADRAKARRSLKLNRS